MLEDWPTLSSTYSGLQFKSHRSEGGPFREILYDSRREAFFQTTTTKANAFPFCALLLLRRFSWTERPKTKAASKKAVQSCTERDYRKKMKKSSSSRGTRATRKGTQQGLQAPLCLKRRLYCAIIMRARNFFYAKSNNILIVIAKKMLNFYRLQIATGRDQQPLNP